jgi:MFS family permease
MRQMRPIFFASFLYFAHQAVVMYINSTVLSTYVSAEYTSLFYVFGAALSLVLLFCLPHIVQKVGLVKTTVGVFLLTALSLLVLGVSANETFVGAFVAYSALSGIVWYCTDLFIAHYSKSGSIGHDRGLFLTIANAAVALMPVISGILVARTGLHSVYMMAGFLLCIGAGIIIRTQKHFVDTAYETPSIAHAWHAITSQPSLRRAVSINFILQFFYAWMVLFSPLYMRTVLHFNWEQIGTAFSIMLTAFVIFQYAIGKWSDTVGEKRLLIAGFIFGGISTVVFALTDSSSILVYTAILFCTRVGMCIVEVLGETYFFKQVSDKDEGIVGVYRMMYPLAYIIAPVLGWYIVSISSYSTLFAVLGCMLLVSGIYTIRLVDIR